MTTNFLANLLSLSFQADCGLTIENYYALVPSSSTSVALRFCFLIETEQPRLLELYIYGRWMS